MLPSLDGTLSNGREKSPDVVAGAAAMLLGALLPLVQPALVRSAALSAQDRPLPNEWDMLGPPMNRNGSDDRAVRPMGGDVALHDVRRSRAIGSRRPRNRAMSGEQS